MTAALLLYTAAYLITMYLLARFFVWILNGNEGHK